MFMNASLCVSKRVTKKEKEVWCGFSLLDVFLKASHYEARKKGSMDALYESPFRQREYVSVCPQGISCMCEANTRDGGNHGTSCQRKKIWFKGKKRKLHSVNPWFPEHGRMHEKKILSRMCKLSWLHETLTYQVEKLILLTTVGQKPSWVCLLLIQK